MKKILLFIGIFLCLGLFANLSMANVSVTSGSVSQAVSAFHLSTTAGDISPGQPGFCQSWANTVTKNCEAGGHSPILCTDYNKLYIGMMATGGIVAHCNGPICVANMQSFYCNSTFNVSKKGIYGPCSEQVQKLTLETDCN